MTYKTAFNWVSKHYTIEETEENYAPAIATVTWDYHWTSGDVATQHVFNIFNGINAEGNKEGLEPGTIPMEAIQKEATSKIDALREKLIGKPKFERIVNEYLK